MLRSVHPDVQTEAHTAHSLHPAQNRPCKIYFCPEPEVWHGQYGKALLCSCPCHPDHRSQTSGSHPQRSVFHSTASRSPQGGSQRVLYTVKFSRIVGHQNVRSAKLPIIFCVRSLLIFPHEMLIQATFPVYITGTPSCSVFPLKRRCSCASSQPRRARSR